MLDYRHTNYMMPDDGVKPQLLLLQPDFTHEIQVNLSMLK